MKLAQCFLFICFYITCHAQNTVGLLAIDKINTSPGYNLIYPHNQPNVYLFDQCGQVVHMWEDDDDFRPGNSAYILENGNLVKTKRFFTGPQDPIWAGGAGEFVEIRSWDNQMIKSFELNNDTARLHHDIAPMPNGNVLMIAWELKTETQSIEAGRDTSLLAQDKVWSEMILEWDPILDSIIWEWHVWDHLVQNFDSTKDNFGDPSISKELIDLNYDEHDGHPDWLHINAIDYNPVLDQIMMSVPYFNEVWIIDHSTSTAESASHLGGNSDMGGDLLYRWGNDKTIGDTTRNQLLFFQHDPNYVNPMAQPGDPNFNKIIVYNNRVGPTLSTINTITMPYNEQLSSYSLSEEGNFLPNDFDGTYSLPDNVRASSVSLSGAQLLPNGNILACSGRFGYLYELNEDSKLVWEYLVPVKGGALVNQGDTINITDNITFRVERYPLDYGAFTSRDLSPINYLELDPNLEFCDTISDVEDVFSTVNIISISTNISNHAIQLSNAKNLIYTIVSVDGHILSRAKALTNNEEIAISELHDGLYYLHIEKNRSFPFIKMN